MKSIFLSFVAINILRVQFVRGSCFLDVLSKAFGMIHMNRTSVGKFDPSSEPELSFISRSGLHRLLNPINATKEGVFMFDNIQRFMRLINRYI